MTYSPHSVKVEGQVVDRVERTGQRLTCHKQMSQVGTRVPRTHFAAALRVGRALVPGKARVLDVQPTLRSKQQTVASSASGQHAVHHLHSHCCVLSDLFRIAYAHHISRPAFGQEFQRVSDHLLSFLPRLAHTQAPNSVTGEPHLYCSLCRFAPQISVHATLNDPEQYLFSWGLPGHLRLMRIEVIFAALGPTQRQIHGLSRTRLISRVFCALIESHDDVSPQRDLYLDRTLGSKEMRRAIKMRAKIYSFLADLPQITQAEHLKSTGVGKQRPLPAHEFVESAQA